MQNSRRQADRELFGAAGTLFCKNGNVLSSCVMRDFSSSGGQFELSEGTVLPRYFLLSLMPDGSQSQLCGKLWQLGCIVGVRFIQQNARSPQPDRKTGPPPHVTA